MTTVSTQCANYCGVSRYVCWWRPGLRAERCRGFASQAGMWAEFDVQWAGVLQRYGVPTVLSVPKNAVPNPFNKAKQKRKKAVVQGKLMAEAFKTGDIVQLKSGGPKMTVSAIGSG